MKPQTAPKTHVRFLLLGTPKSKNETKLTTMNTTKLIFMLTVGDILFVMKVAKRPPGIVMTRTSMKTSPDMTPLNPSSTRNVTATVVKELMATKQKLFVEAEEMRHRNRNESDYTKNTHQLLQM